MYTLYKIKDTIRVPPKEFGENLNKAILGLVQEEYEGIVDEDLGVVIAVTSVENVGEGKVVPGDGAAYYSAELEMLLYKPEMHELVEGFVSEVTEFGAFVRVGPVEGLVHVSQIMDDYIDYDAKLPGFVGKKTKKKLVVNDNVVARVVTISLKDTIPNSKIGLTMRQPFLGKPEWRKSDEKAKKKKDSEKKGKKDAKPEKAEKPDDTKTEETKEKTK